MEQNKANIYDNILNAFCGEGWSRKPFYQGENVYATDGKKAIKMDKKLPLRQYEVLKEKDVEHVFSFMEERREKIVNLKALEESIDVPLVDDYVLCYTCEGSGYRRCNLGEDHACDECDGTGKKGLRNGRKTKDKECIVNMFDRNIKYELLENLFETGKKINVEEAKIIFGPNEGSPTLFQMGEIEVLLMSAFVDEDDKIIKCQYDKNK